MRFLQVCDGFWQAFTGLALTRVDYTTALPMWEQMVQMGAKKADSVNLL